MAHCLPLGVARLVTIGDPSYPIVAMAPQEAESKVHEMHAKLKEVEHKDSRISRHSTQCVVWMIFEPSYSIFQREHGADWRGSDSRC